MTAETSNARGEWVLVPRALVDSFPEINPSNYDHGDACALNAWGVELVLAAKDTAPPPAAAQQQGQAVVCTCPSGDGSLRWPCPSHPPTQQGGGDDLVEAEGEVYARKDVEPEILHEFRPFTAPPSAPAGVEWTDEAAHAFRKEVDSVGAHWHPWPVRFRAGMKAALAQQPAAVDEAMAERFCRRWYEITGRSLERAHVLASLDSALATQHQEPTT